MYYKKKNKIHAVKKLCLYWYRKAQERDSTNVNKK